MTSRNAKILLFFVIAFRATALLFSSICLESMGPMTVLAVRFLLAFALLCLIFFKKLSAISKNTIKYGVIIGIFFFATMVCEMYCLDYTSSSVAAFLENTSVVLVPLVLAAMAKVRPSIIAVLSSVLALAGVGFLVLQNGHFVFNIGEIFGVFSAIFYTGTIIATGKLADKDDPLLIGIIQVGTIGVLSLAASFILESPTLPTDPKTWGAMLFLVIVCTGFGFTLQPLAQKFVSTETAGMFTAFNPLIAAILGILFLGEVLTVNSAIGSVLILVAIIISTVVDGRKSKDRESSSDAFSVVSNTPNEVSKVCGDSC